MLFKKMTAVFCSAALLVLSGLPSSPVSGSEQNNMRDITTMELVREMGIGINLGNTFESCGDWIAQYSDGSVTSYETAWGSPIITKDIIQGYANEGFGVLRIPVAWSNMMSEDYTISSEYIDRVKQVTDWAIEADLYVILNIHWDGGWFSGFSTDKETCMTKYTRVWEQLTAAFGDYGDRLMFESLNEEGVWDDIWNRYGGTNGKQEAYDLLGEINQTFVDIVRDSGGNNAERHLLIAGYATDVTLTCDDMFIMPYDPQNRCAVSVHYYTPSTFAILEEDASWGKMRSTWGTDADFNELNGYLDDLKETFIDKGVPVIIGEYGCPTNNKDADSVRLYLSSVCEGAYTRNICPVLWDITDLHYSRTTYTLKDSLLALRFKSILNIPCELGDVNSDGTINAVDASAVLKAYAMIATNQDTGLGENQSAASDVNADGVINGVDASIILSYYAHTATGGSMTFEEYLAQ